ncbi:MAG TPA: lysophospholipid acyltransferase family protein [Candidatus Bathyarchaeia archaeon]|nr:lysophospholipid acyltransferase family protein [Candidatus Bathyarchaeia archaeon]
MRSRIARLIVRGLFAAIFRVRHDGRLPSHGPLLVVANHQGWADGFLLAASFPLSAEVRLLGDREGTGKVWWWRAVLRAVGIVIPIERSSNTADRAAIAATLAALEHGAVVVVFAEGRVSRAESALGPFARGVGYLALRSGAPILPVWLSGTAELYLRKELVTIAGTPRVVPRDAPTKEATRTLALALHDDLARLEPSEHAPDPARKRMRWLTNLF